MKSFQYPPQKSWRRQRVKSYLRKREALAVSNKVSLNKTYMKDSVDWSTTETGARCTPKRENEPLLYLVRMRKGIKERAGSVREKCFYSNKSHREYWAESMDILNKAWNSNNRTDTALLSDAKFFFVFSRLCLFRRCSFVLSESDSILLRCMQTSPRFPKTFMVNAQRGKRIIWFMLSGYFEFIVRIISYDGSSEVPSWPRVELFNVNFLW